MAITTRPSRQLRLETLEGRVTPALATSAALGVPVLEAQASRDVVFVDEYLLDQVPQQELAGRDVVTVSASSDAISQISAALAARANVGVVRLISHGEAGAILLGDQVIDQRVLAAHSREIASWGSHLAPGADILVYGCSVASTEDGIAFTDYLARLTGADVAASTGLTGANGGDATLEYATGQVTHALGATLAQWEEAGLSLPTPILPNQRTGMGISMTAGSSQQFPNLTAFAEINRDGTVSGWGSATAGGTIPTILGSTSATGFVRTVQLYSNEAAFAALRSDGSVIVWGDNAFGATPPSGTIANSLTSGVVAIYSTQNGFAALKSDKTIVWWYGSNSADSGTRSAPSGTVTITGVYTTQRAYAALRSDGTVDLFGDATAGGSLLTGQSIPTNVQTIVSNQRAFAAIGAGNDGAAWGDTAYGGGGTAAAAYKVFSNQRAFAYTLADGSVKVWGDATYGGGTYTTSLKNVVNVTSTERAFCAVNASGDVEAWGDAAYGGTGAPASIGAGGQVFSTGSAFAAFSGSAGNLSLVTVWGNAANGGTSPGALTGVANVYSNTGAFAVIKNVDANGNGTVQAWGNANFGGTTPSPAPATVTQVYATNNQFTAQKADRSVVSWGNGTPTAPSTTTSTQVASPLVQRPWFVSNSSTSFQVGVANTTFDVTARAIPFATVDPYTQGDITYAIYSINGNTSSTTLPSGLSFNASSGRISGTPAAGTGGLYNIIFTATNTVGKTYDSNFALTINEPVGSITSANSASYNVLSTNTFTVTTTGGYPLANTFSLSSGTPSWVTIAATSNGQASMSVNPPTGTAVTGTYTFTITAGNGFSPNATQNFTLTINKITPTLSWTSFTSPITYGDLLSSNATTGQLNAVLGNLGAGGATPSNANTVYKADGNTVTTANFLAANAAGYVMTATSESTADYNSVTINPPAGAKLVVNKFTPGLSWTGFTSPIIYGDLLSTNASTGQLNAVLTGSSTAGTTQPTALVYTRPTNITLNAGDLLNAGTYPITASSAESANYNPRSETRDLTVQKAATTTSLVAAPNPSVYGTSVTFTATVTGRGAGAIPSGSVEFYDGTTLLSTQTLSSGVAVYSTNALTVGSHNIVAKYTGNANYLNSDSPTVAQSVTKASSSTALTTSLNPSTYGDLVTFTATVTGVAGLLKPTGTVAFTDGSTQIGTASVDSNGVATFSIGTLLASTLSVNHSIEAQYSGDANYFPSTSAPPLVQTVLAATPVPTVSTSPASSTYGDQITISASVPAVGLGTIPVGSVNFFGGLNGTTLLTPIPVPLDSQGKASFNYRWLPAGDNLVSVQFVSQDPNYNNATSATLTQTVAKADQLISWNPLVSTITYGTPLGADQLNATVTGVAGDPSYVPTLVYDPASGTVLGASTNAYALAVEAVANSSVNPNYNPAFAAVPLTVLKATPLPTVLSSPNPSIYGGVVTITASVPAVNSGAVPVGTVIFLNGATEIGRGSLDTSGTASLSYSQLLAGNNSLSIQFVSQDPNYNDATSPAVTQTVNKAATTTALIVSPNPSIYGTSITFTATVTGVSGALLPTGDVRFVDSATSALLGTGTLANGVATFSTSALLAGNAYSIVASYLGDSNYNASDSPQDPLVINKANTSTTVTTQAPAPFGTLLTISATVAGVQGALVPTGTVTFVSGATNLGTYTLNSQGVASFTVSTLPVATNTITATYNGDPNYNTSTGNANQVINKANTTTTVVSSLNPSLLTNSVTFTATVVQASGAPFPSGTVQFTYGSTSLGTITVDSQGKASVTTTTMPPGISTVVATYSGDGNYNGSNGNVQQTVNWAPTITSANATTFTVGTTGSFTVTSTGYPDRTYAIAGNLPTGVTFDTGTGILSGNAAALTGGTYPLVITASNGIDPVATQNFTLTVNEAPAITSANTVTFTETIAGSFTVTSTGFPARVYALTGALPTGMSFSTSTGVLSGTPADGTLGTYPVTVTATNGVGTPATQALTINVWRNVPAATGSNLTTPFDLGPGSYVVSLGNGNVLINNPSGKQQQFTPFPGFKGTLSTSLVDRNGDGTADSIMVAVATGGAPAVLVLDAGTGNVAYNFYAFDPGFRGGVTVAGGVTKIDGKATTVVLGGAGPGAEPSISAFDAVTGTFRKAFYAYAQAYRGGVRVAMSGPDSTGQSLVVASPAINSHVTTFTLEDPSRALASFYAFNPVNLYQGVWVAAGHLNGDGLSELVVGAGPGKNGKAEISVFDLQGNLLKNFLAFAQGFTGGVSVAVSDYNKDGVGDIFASSGAGAKATFNVFNYGDLSLIDAVFLPTDSLLGTFVANNPSAGSKPYTPGGQPG